MKAIRIIACVRSFESRTEEMDTTDFESFVIGVSLTESQKIIHKQTATGHRSNSGTEQ
jgi:hypothetical protein